MILASRLRTKELVATSRRDFSSARVWDCFRERNDVRNDVDRSLEPGREVVNR